MTFSGDWHGNAIGIRAEADLSRFVIDTVRLVDESASVIQISHCILDTASGDTISSWTHVLLALQGSTSSSDRLTAAVASISCRRYQISPRPRLRPALKVDSVAFRRTTDVAVCVVSITCRHSFHSTAEMFIQIK